MTIALLIFTLLAIVWFAVEIVRFHRESGPVSLNCPPPLQGANNMNPQNTTEPTETCEGNAPLTLAEESAPATQEAPLRERQRQKFKDLASAIALEEGWSEDEQRMFYADLMITAFRFDRALLSRSQQGEGESRAD